MCFYDTIPSLTLTKGAVLLMKNQKRTLISCAMLEDEVNHILEKHTLRFQSYGLTVAFTTDRKI